MNYQFIFLSICPNVSQACPKEAMLRSVISIGFVPTVPTVPSIYFNGIKAVYQQVVEWVYKNVKISQSEKSWDSWDSRDKAREYYRFSETLLGTSDGTVGTHARRAKAHRPSGSFPARLRVGSAEPRSIALGNEK